MPLLFSAVSSRALNYDTVLKDLSNPRVFTDLNCAAFACLRTRCCFIQRSLRFYTEFFVTVNKFKIIFYLLSAARILEPLRWLTSSRAVLLNGVRDYSTLF